MKRFAAFNMILAFFMLPALLLGEQEATGRCTIEFQGSAPKHPFSGKAESEPFSVKIAEGDVAAWSVTVPVEEMKTGDSLQEKLMYRMFDIKNYPTLHGTFNDVNLADKQNSIAFTLTIRDVSNQVTANVTNWSRQQDTVTFTLEFDVSLKKFKLRAPSLLGVYKVEDTIKINSKFTLTNIN